MSTRQSTTCRRTQLAAHQVQVLDTGILVATDLSSRFEEPLERAVLLAREEACHLAVLHVIDQKLPTDTAALMMAGAKEKIQSSLERMLSPDSGKVEIVVTRGEIYETILSEAAHRKCGLIVLGSHHMGAAGRFHCCRTEQVVCASGIPVLSVQTEPTESYRKVVVAVDFSDSSASAVRSALQLAPDAEFRWVHAYGLPFSAIWGRNQAREKLLQECRTQFARMMEDAARSDRGETGILRDRISCVLKEGQALDVIDEEVRTSGADLLVLGSSHADTSRQELGSVTQAFLSCPPCDVLFQPSHQGSSD